MVQQIFDALFLTTFFALPAVVVVGLALLAWPRRKDREITVHHHAPVRV
jgi:hypothetical protein